MNFNPNDIRSLKPTTGEGRKLYIETYGCQMNAGDSEVVVSILQGDGFIYTEELEDADVILINTCSIRDNAEQRIWGRLKELKPYKKRKRGLLVGVIGCMAERLKDRLIEREDVVDIVAGPDTYRDLPRLVREAGAGGSAVNVLLSREETYAEISPVRLDKNGVSAFISIMRGCNNMCSYCVVPYTRGGERSRDPKTILREAEELFAAGYREVTLLGQNVNSYNWRVEDSGGKAGAPLGSTPGAGPKITAGDLDTISVAAGTYNENVYGNNNSGAGNTYITGNATAGEPTDFASLIESVARISPLLRVRFSTSHPKDLSDKVLETMSRYPNLCRAIHLPAQSGSSRVLELMNRKYSREWYLGRIEAIRKYLPGCAISTDLIAGFCSESVEDHEQTISLMREVGYEFAFMFKYSERPDTRAARQMKDDVSDETKTARLTEIINLQNELSLASNRRDIGKRFEVLVEGVSKRRDDQLFGRNSQNKVIVFDRHDFRPGDYVEVTVNDCSSATLFGIDPVLKYKK